MLAQLSFYKYRIPMPSKKLNNVSVMDEEWVWDFKSKQRNEHLELFKIFFDVKTFTCRIFRPTYS